MTKHYVDTPTINDIVYQSNGKKEMKNHLGNKRFRSILQSRLEDFERDPLKQNNFASRLYNELLVKHPNMRFLRRDKNLGFVLLSEMEAKENIQTTLVGMASEKGRQTATSKVSNSNKKRNGSKLFVLGEIDPNKVVDLTNDEESDHKKKRKKELYSPKLASSNPEIVDMTNDDSDDEVDNKKESNAPRLASSNLMHAKGAKCPTFKSSPSMDDSNANHDENTDLQCVAPPVLTNNESKKLPHSEATPLPESPSHEDMVGYYEEEDLMDNDILYIEGDQVEVEIANDPFERVLLANYAEYQENREDPCSREQFRVKCLGDLEDQNPFVRFLRYDGNVEKYLEWDPDEALEMIRQAMEARIGDRIKESKSLHGDEKADVNATQEDPTASQNPTALLSPQKSDSQQESPDATLPFVDAAKSGLETLPKADSCTSSSRTILSDSAMSPRLAKEGQVDEPPLKFTPSSDPEVHIDSTATRPPPQDTNIGSSNNGLVSQACAPPSKEALPLDSTDIARNDLAGSVLTKEATVAPVVKDVEDSSLGLNQPKTVADHQPHDHQPSGEESDDDDEELMQQMMNRAMERGYSEG